MVTSVHGIQIQLHVAYSVYSNNLLLCSWHAYDMCNVTSVGVFYVLLLLLFACELMLVHVRAAAGQAVQITIMM